MSLNAGLEIAPKQQYQSCLCGWAFRTDETLKIDDRALPLALKHLEIDVVLVATFGARKGSRDDHLLTIYGDDLGRSIERVGTARRARHINHANAGAIPSTQNVPGPGACPRLSG